MNKENISQNLKDAGCDLTTIEKFFNLQKQGQIKEIYKMLFEHKEKLIDSLQKNQKKIDCLDYLIYSLKEDNNE